MVRRQHETTTLPEIQGLECSDFLAVTPPVPGAVNLLFLRLAGTWHRFYLDAGLLFWEEGKSLDEDEEVVEGETCVDWAEQLEVRGASIGLVDMCDCQLTVRFENGARVVLRHGVEDDTTQVLEFVAGGRTEAKCQ